MVITGSVSESGGFIDSNSLTSGTLPQYTGEFIFSPSFISGTLPAIQGDFLNAVIWIEAQRAPKTYQGSLICVSPQGCGGGDSSDSVRDDVENDNEKEIQEVIEEIIGDGLPLRESSFHLADNNNPVIIYDPDWNS